MSRGATRQPYQLIGERLDAGRTLLMDGGVGSELVRRGVRWRDHGMRTDCAAVRALHLEYILAGAHVIRTNTFQINRRIYQNVFRDVAHRRHIGAPDLEQRIPTLIPRAVDLARAARDQAGRTDVAIAGVMSPLEHCFRPDLAPVDDQQAQAEHAEIARLLAHAGVDLLLLESMNTLGEVRLATAAARPTGLPVWVSFVTGADGNLLSGESLTDASRTVRADGAQAVLVNCAPPADVGLALARLDGSDGPIGGYAHIGRFDPPSWKFEFFPRFTDSEAWSPARYASEAGRWRELGATILGGCCGTSPAHVRALAAS